MGTVKLISGGRASGKSAQLAAWAKAGAPRPQFPGYDRIVVTATKLSAEQFTREQQMPVGQVMALSDFRQCRVIPVWVKVGLDDADLMLTSLCHGRGHVKAVVFNTEPLLPTFGGPQSPSSPQREGASAGDDQCETQSEVSGSDGANPLHEYRGPKEQLYRKALRERENGAG